MQDFVQKKEPIPKIIEVELDDLVDNFSNYSNGLFEITGKYTKTYDQAFYLCAIVKPTKRIKAALSVDREILVVSSNFKDQQQRTIKLVKQEIENSGGRFESTIAIILHKDKEGNSKLKNWGRDQGLSILPLNGLNLDKWKDLEKELCTELYSHDPFDITGPVSDDGNFFGRRDEAIELARKLQRGQIHSCLGIRKVGKTSIINRVISEIEKNHDCITIMIDCSRDDIWHLNAAQLLSSIADTFKESLEKSLNYSVLKVSKNNLGVSVARDNLQLSLNGFSKKLIIVFDEIDYITPGSPTNSEWRNEFNSFWRGLRAVYQECARQSKQLSLLVGGVSTYWFTVESINDIENSALLFVPEEYLSPMPEGATVAMLKRLGRIAGLNFDESVAVEIAKATGNMPYWARKCCSYIHRNINISSRPYQLKNEEVQRLINLFVSEEGSAISEVALRHLFKVHPQLLDSTRKCLAGKSSEVPKSLRRVLVRYGVLTNDFILSGLMIQNGFKSLEESFDTNSASDIKNEKNETKINSLNEWAEEIAALGKRRNLLEKRLRDLVLNFIRFDAFSKGKASEAKGRVLSILPEPQRIKLNGFTAEDIISRFLWTDLYKLIIKEKEIFNKIIGDQAQFTRNCEIVNDRFDAHAKEADQADFALYRRSLKYLEDKIAEFQ